jgi:small subunit ribosomal protein S4
MKGNTAENLLKLLNLRFDNIVFKGGFTSSHTSARMLITQGHFQIDNRNVNIPSYQLKPGQQITIKENKKIKKYWQDNLPLIDKKERPNWLDYDNKSQQLKIINIPEVDKIENIFDTALIIEFYSK